MGREDTQGLDSSSPAMRGLFCGRGWLVCLLGDMSARVLGNGNPFWKNIEGRWPTSVHKRRTAECLFRNAGVSRAGART